MDYPSVMIQHDLMTLFVVFTLLVVIYFASGHFESMLYRIEHLLLRIEKALCRIETLLTPVESGPHSIEFLTSDGQKVVQMNLKANNQLPLTVSVADEFGNPTTGTFDAAPAWSVSDPTLGAVVAAADGMSGIFTPAGKLGSCNLQVLGAVAGAAVQGTLPLVIIPGDVAEVALVAGTPVPFTPAAAPAPAAASPKAI